MAAIFLAACLFMLNRTWLTARPWQNKIRVPFCTSVSLSHRIRWQVSWGEELYTLYSMQAYFSPSHFLFYPLSWSYFASIHLSLYSPNSTPLRSSHTAYNLLCDTSVPPSLSLSLFLIFFLLYLFHLLLLSLCTTVSISCFLSLPLPPFPRVPRLKTQRGFRFC